MLRFLICPQVPQQIKITKIEVVEVSVGQIR